MDIFATATLNGVVDSLLRAQAAILNLFFPMVSQSQTKEIKFDIENGKRRIAPFVSPLVEGKVVEALGYKTATFETAYVKDKRIFNPADTLKRIAGEQIGGSMTPADRRSAKLIQEMADQQNMLTRRMEVMASETVRTGKVTVKGEGFDTVVVDFGRNANHTVTLAGAARWGQAGISPKENIEDWALTILKNSGAVIDNVVMDTLAYRFFIADQKVKDVLDIRRGSPDTVVLGSMAALGLSYKGSIDNVKYWVYSDWYVDPDTGTETAMIPDNTVILGSSRIDGVRHFGAIEDEDALSSGLSGISGATADGLLAREMFVKSWVTKDPSVRFLMSQSAPLTVPYRPDASFCATVN